jgi:hypothetical protein
MRGETAEAFDEEKGFEKVNILTSLGTGPIS